jgi:Fe-S cluster assembly protein SufD
VHFSIFIELQSRSQLTVFEEYCGQEGARYFVNSMTQIQLAANSHLSYSRLVQDSLTAYNIGQTRAYLEASSSLNSLVLAMGSLISRHNLETYLLGEGASAKINGAYAVDKDQHVDNHTLIDHVVGNCQTSQAYKGILNGHSRAVFNGEVHIRHGALKASSEQINNNLLLSNNAEADSKPELKIYADDVKATHGSTVGALNPDEIFYLQSRAIPKAEAIKILSLGFLTDVIYQFNNEVLEDYLIKVMSEYYNKIQGA